MMLLLMNTIPLTLMIHTIYPRITHLIPQTISILQRKNNTSNITNNITRHNHNNYDHNVIKKVHKHMKHINNYDTDINYDSKET